MRKIPKELVKEMEEDPYYKVCARRATDGSNCAGRITWEHVFIYAGKQINEVWSIIPLCERHHGVNSYQDRGLLDKQMNEYISLCRATDEDLALYPKKDWKTLRDYLKKRYESAA